MQRGRNGRRDVKNEVSFLTQHMRLTLDTFIISETRTPFSDFFQLSILTENKCKKCMVTSGFGCSNKDVSLLFVWACPSRLLQTQSSKQTSFQIWVAATQGTLRHISV